MHPTELQLIQLSKQIIGVAQQAAMAYEQAQAALRLDQLFTLESVETVDGTRRALETVAQLEALHRQHKQMYATFVTAAMEQLTSAIAVLPADKARAQEHGLADSLNKNLASQAEGYLNRERWIAAVREMFTIVNDNRDLISFANGQMVMHDNDVADRYDAAQQVIDDIHEYEVAQMKEKLAQATIAKAYLDEVERGGRP
ncbi:hypothetical protein GJ698_06020 [Pseudoduganella sp. FT26W]|uniref:Uncharacterized protein n=1 Tax=Duganella aquatilis TaxID=2666082 RepID=A0A844D7Y8_9BURK|nr:hypothetical protein [Duganella aquatilis]MRW83650.1 hypothetical protein [Duganella aquatilis]